MYSQLGQVDAVVLASGQAAFGTLPELSDDQVQSTLDDLRGRIAVVRYGLANVADGGSTSHPAARSPSISTSRRCRYV